jgi:catechol 1,2-dioxygenase/hydroxyquinol 1,2-dioxygenase
LLQDDNQSITTETNLEGPMYLPNAPERQMGDRLGMDTNGKPLLLSGRVLDSNGQPIDKAVIDVWQANSQGLYDLQDSTQPKNNFRGCFRTQADGQYEFETVVPMAYNVPATGPCGEVLRLLGRHTWRAAHIHFKLSASGYIPLTTQIFLDGDFHLDSDTTFSVKSAIIKLKEQQDQNKLFYTAQFDFVLRSIKLL